MKTQIQEKAKMNLNRKFYQHMIVSPMAKAMAKAWTALNASRHCRQARACGGAC